MKHIEHRGNNYVKAESHERIETVSDALDLMASARSFGTGNALIIAQENIDASFFDLSSGFAGEVLQKFSTYRMRLAITGPTSHFTSKALRDFIYECNKAKQILWVENEEEALKLFS